MVELGLAPESTSGKKLRSMLKTLSEDERRKAKRKFRKVWKKILKSDPDLASSMGAGKDQPSGRNMRSRRAWVRRKISLEICQE